MAIIVALLAFFLYLERFGQEEKKQHKSSRNVYMFREINLKAQAHLSRLRSKHVFPIAILAISALWNPATQVPTALL